jgi:hypothetical protein
MWCIFLWEFDDLHVCTSRRKKRCKKRENVRKIRWFH